LFPLLAWLDANPGGIATRGSDDGSAPGHDEAPMCRGLGCFLVSDGGFEPLTSSVQRDIQPMIATPQAPDLRLICPAQGT
jgi:hypothetical protein